MKGRPFPNGRGRWCVEVTVTESGAGMTLHRWAWFLPDGKHFLYYSFSVSGTDRAVYAGALGSKEQVLVLHNESKAIYAARARSVLRRSGIARELVRGTDLHNP